jgi:tetratricopeptide (TPR) repeat protein
MFDLAEIYRAANRCDTALTLYQRVFEIHSNTPGPANIEIARTRNNMGICFTALGRYAEAEKAYTEAIAISEQVLGEDDVEVAYCMNNMAAMMVAQKRYPEAQRLSTIACETIETKLGPMADRLGEALLRRAQIMEESGQLKEAEKTYGRVLTIWDKSRNSLHPSYTTTMLALSELYKKMGDNDKALQTSNMAMLLINQRNMMKLEREK